MHWFYWSFLSAVFAACTAILAKIGVASTDSNTATAIRTTVVLILSWAIVIGTKGAGALYGIPAQSWLPLVASGVATGLSWLCYFKALQNGPASKVAPVDKLSVVLVVVFAAVFSHEPMSVRTIAGVSLIAGGVFVLATA